MRKGNEKNILGARYGEVQGLGNEELADEWELERQVTLAQWGPVLQLPVRTKHGWIKPSIDEDGGVDFGAFGTVDFERKGPKFDSLRCRTEMLREKLRDVLIMMSIVRQRLPGQAYRVLKYLRMGVIGLEHICDEDTLAFARLHRRAKTLRAEIGRVQEVRAARQARLAEVMG